MELEQMSIHVRERKTAELYELAILVFRRHLAALLLLAFVGATPFLLLDWWLLRGWEDDGWGVLYPLMLLIAFETPMMTAPISAYVGQAMFSRQPSIPRAFVDGYRRLPGLFVYGLLRGFFATTLIASLFIPPHAAECLILERQRYGTAMGRAWRISNYYAQENIGHLLLNVLIVAVGVLTATIGIYTFLNILQLAGHPLHEFLPRMHPSHGWSLFLLPPFFAYLAVLRFCSYIDLRTRREGWEVELDCRRVGNRLAEARR